MNKVFIKEISLEDARKLGVDSWGEWGCEKSEFDWFYDDDESAYIFEGDVTVRTDHGEYRIREGMFVNFPSGLSCRWIVHKRIRKAYKFGFDFRKHIG